MSRIPDYKVAAMDKATGARQPRVGAAWRNPDGSISLQIDRFVVLSGHPDLVVTLFPAEGERQPRLGVKSDPDEVPF